MLSHLFTGLRLEEITAPELSKLDILRQVHPLPPPRGSLRSTSVLRTLGLVSFTLSEAEQVHDVGPWSPDW